MPGYADLLNQQIQKQGDPIRTTTTQKQGFDPSSLALLLYMIMQNLKPGTKTSESLGETPLPSARFRGAGGANLLANVPGGETQGLGPTGTGASNITPQMLQMLMQMIGGK